MTRAPISAFFASTLTLLFPLTTLGADNPTSIPSAIANVSSQYNAQKRFDFSSAKQLRELPPFGEDPSYIRQGKLLAPIAAGERKGLSKKFYFEKGEDYTNEAEISFDITLDSNFQSHADSTQPGKFAGLEGSDASGAVEGGKGVIAQDSWSVRIGHWQQNANGRVPIGLVIHHPNQSDQKGITVKTNYALQPLNTYRLTLYVKLNDAGANNGVVKLAVNGKQVYSSVKWKLRLRKNTHITSVWLQNDIGGKAPAPEDTSVTLDNLRILWSKCTQAGCTGTKLEIAPSPPNSLKAVVQ